MLVLIRLQYTVHILLLVALNDMYSTYICTVVGIETMYSTYNVGIDYYVKNKFVGIGYRAHKICILLIVITMYSTNITSINNQDYSTYMYIFL